MTNPLLAGVRILDLTRLLPGPHATQLLAQLGAEVIKIEDPDGGDYARELSPALFEQVNRGKASVTLDLRSADDVAAFKRLVADADVVIESFRPGVMDRLGCGYETLKAINPKLVYAALTGYGQSGPLAAAAGHDLNYLSLAGVLDQTGNAGAAPAMSNVQIADLAGGALTCAVGLLAAVIGARNSGEGTFVDAAMLDGSLALLPVAMATRQQFGHTQPRGADTLTGALPNYRVYKCRDGRYLAVGALEPKFFARLLDRLNPIRGNRSPKPAGHPEKQAGQKGRRAGTMSTWADRLNAALADPRRARRLTQPVHWGLAALFRTRSRDAWVNLLTDTDACTTPVLTLEEALAHPQVQARGMQQGGALGCPLRFDGHARQGLSPSPGLGADNERFL
ncbi:CaiB/BaiF CoA-transferase family protein [Salinisphaera sp.]|uniref:CaiB/BaiF CoA transferase family protein n=1 Tax=Salinisphaera sp. TaxID=1914330 RepID=UPI000C37D33D|nr:CaiB/BaiF CoA-transferase family protein [Salinisphaera sp.]MBS64029.1 carnitine dehydratase [Salinisphaera sp.]